MTDTWVRVLHQRPILAVAVGAAVVRLLPLPFVLGALPRSLERGFAGDGNAYYVPLAESLASTGRFDLGGAPCLSHVPLYPLMLAVLATAGSLSPAAIAGVQSLIGAAVLTLLFVWVSHLAGRRIAVLATALAAVTADFTVYSYLNLAENLMALFVLGAFALATADFRRSRAILWLSAGGLLGLAALTREFSLTLLLPLAAVTPGEPGRAARLGGIAALLLGASLIVLPWAVRNTLRAGEAMILTDKWALNVYIATLIGEHHASDPRRMWDLPDAGQRQRDEALRSDLAQARSRRAANALYLRATWRNLTADPGGQAAFLVRKAGFFWQPNIGVRHAPRIGYGTLLFLVEYGYYALLALASAAWFVDRRVRSRSFLCLWALIGWTFFFHLFVGEAEPRYHFILLPSVFVLAASTCAAAIRRVRWFGTAEVHVASARGSIA